MMIFQIFSEDIAEYYRETTGLHVTENFLLQDMPEEWLYYPDFLDQPEVLFFTSPLLTKLENFMGLDMYAISLHYT